MTSLRVSFPPFNKHFKCAVYGLSGKLHCMLAEEGSLGPREPGTPLTRGNSKRCYCWGPPPLSLQGNWQSWYCPPPPSRDGDGAKFLQVFQPVVLPWGLAAPVSPGNLLQVQALRSCSVLLGPKRQRWGTRAAV